MRTSDSSVLQFIEWPGREPAAVFVHGAGFHAHCWDAVIEPLTQRCVAVNLRGHGGVSAPHMALSWRDFAADVVHACDAAGVREAVGVGHSLGGYAVTVAAALRPDLFRALLLIDPVILPEAAYGAAIEAPPARRRATFASAEEMRARLAARPPFMRWEPRVLDDYCRFALRPDGRLWCEPEFEAQIYAAASAADANPYELLRSVQIPVFVLRSGRVDEDNPFSRSPTAHDLAQHFSRAEDAIDARFSHFLPMEAPQYVTERVQMLAA
jgi:pimeloyl-ACP methyl ester carboxylesterase